MKEPTGKYFKCLTWTERNIEKSQLWTNNTFQIKNIQTIEKESKQKGIKKKLHRFLHFRNHSRMRLWGNRRRRRNNRGGLGLRKEILVAFILSRTTLVLFLIFLTLRHLKECVWGSYSWKNLMKALKRVFYLLLFWTKVEITKIKQNNKWAWQKEPILKEPHMKISKDNNNNNKDFKRNSKHR